MTISQKASKELSRTFTDLMRQQRSLAGQATSPRKAAAARRNGRKGGRPRTRTRKRK